MPDRTCNVPGCEKPCRRSSSELCAMHYHRRYRHGSVYIVAPPALPVVRYKQRAIAGHPLAGAENKVYVHRVELFAAIGDGEHPCHWCGIKVRWMAKVLSPAPEDYLTVDHLDGDKHNNHIRNLVPSCGRCNTARASHLKHVRLVEAGMWSNNDTIAHLGPRSSDRFYAPSLPPRSSGQAADLRFL